MRGCDIRFTDCKSMEGTMHHKGMNLPNFNHFEKAWQVVMSAAVHGAAIASPNVSLAG